MTCTPWSGVVWLRAPTRFADPRNGKGKGSFQRSPTSGAPDVRLRIGRSLLELGSERRRPGVSRRSLLEPRPSTGCASREAFPVGDVVGSFERRPRVNALRHL